MYTWIFSTFFLSFCFIHTYVNMKLHKRKQFMTRAREKHTQNKQNISTHIQFIKTSLSKWKTSMSRNNNTTLSLLAIPVELVYRILDNLDQLSILLSVQNVCLRLNTIANTYHRYQVNFSFIFTSDIHHHLRSIVYFNSKSHFPLYSLQNWALDQTEHPLDTVEHGNTSSCRDQWNEKYCKTNLYVVV